MSEFHPTYRDKRPTGGRHRSRSGCHRTIWRASWWRLSSNSTYDSLAFRYIAATTHPDHDTLCTFQTRFVGEIESLFVQVLGIARQMKRLKLGTVAVDGTKPHANPSRPSALSYGHAEKLEARRRETRLKAIGRMRAAYPSATNSGRCSTSTKGITHE